MLPLWENRYPDDDNMRRVVDSLERWAATPTSEGIEAVQAANRIVAGYTCWCESCSGPKNQSDCAGDFAGDAIVWAAKAVAEVDDEEEFRSSARQSVDHATEGFARQLAGTWFPNEDTDYWSLAKDALRAEILARL
jgi:hypothetical protein